MSKDRPSRGVFKCGDRVEIVDPTRVSYTNGERVNATWRFDLARGSVTDLGLTPESRPKLINVVRVRLDDVVLTDDQHDRRAPSAEVTEVFVARPALRLLDIVEDIAELGK